MKRHLLHPFMAALLSTLICSTSVAAPGVDQIAESYVKLVLTLGNHDPGYVDAYYGPQEWQVAAQDSPMTAEAIAQQALDLRQQLPDTASDTDPMQQLRLVYLNTQLSALAAYARSLSNDQPRDFDREAKAFYDTTPPTQEYQEFDAILAELDALLPGDAPLHQRVNNFYRAYEIPASKLTAVFEAAIEACRERTKQHIALPAGENFVLEYVTDKPWSGYNWYQGNAMSLIQVNTSLPIRIDRAIDLGCHEGYPGHHTYNALLESEFVNKRGWMEFSVYPLFSPQSLIAEGSANYGIELAFPGQEKTAFEMAVLYPLAGLDPATAQKYQQVSRITAQLSFARNQTARLYINGKISKEEAIGLSQKYGPTSRERAEQSVRFIDTYGAYVINYNWGKQLVKAFVERGTETTAQRWAKFSQLLSSPRLPSSLFESP